MTEPVSSSITDELEAIEAVLCEDYKRITDIKDTANYAHSFEAFIFPCEDLNECHCSIQLRIDIPTHYPNIVPNIEILSKDGISDNTAQNLIKHLNNSLNKQIKQEMLYSIIDITKEYLKQYNFIGADQINDNTNDCSDFDDIDSEGFNDNSDGWDDIDECEDNVTFKKSLQSIEKIMKSEQKSSENINKIKYKCLALTDVIDDDISSQRLLAVSNVRELQMCKGANAPFYSEYRQDCESDKYEIRIGIQMCEYIRSRTLLNVLGFWDNEYMVLRLAFQSSDDYINNVCAPQIIEIGKAVPHKKQSTENAENGLFKVKNKLRGFIGSHSIRNRIKNKLFAKLWPPLHLHKSFPEKYKQILQLMSVTQTYSFNECQKVLEFCGNNYEKALVYLTQNGSIKSTENNKGINITNDIESLCANLIKYGRDEMMQKSEEKSDSNICRNNKELKSFLNATVQFFGHNILAQILYFALHSIVTLSERCLVCDIPFPKTGLIKPTICNNKLCIYGYEELEIGLDICAQLKDSPEIIDLLLTFFYISVRKNKMFGHSPIDVHALPPNEHINFKLKWRDQSIDNPYIYQSKPEMKEYNKLDIEKLGKVCESMPSIDRLLIYAKKGGDKGIQKALFHKHKLLWPLLRWLIVSNRSHLVPLREKRERFEGLPNCFQFRFHSYSPEREYRFEQLSLRNGECGYTYAWHGSHISHWHSILRTGLKNMSGTKHMKNGSAFGKGIYLAPMSGVSYWYCEPHRSDTWPLSMFNRSDYYGRDLKSGHSGHGLYCLALCQVLNHSKLKSPEPYYVVPTEEWVMIRYLFVFNTVDNKRKNHWTGKGRYFDINANKLMANYRKKLAAQQQTI